MTAKSPSAGTPSAAEPILTGRIEKIVHLPLAKLFALPHDDGNGGDLAGVGLVERAGAARLSPRSALAVAAGCFATLAIAAALLGRLPADSAVRDAVLSVASPLVLTVAHVVNYAGTWVVLLPATLLLLALVPRARGRWWLWAALMIAAPTAETSIKRLVARPRPEAASMGFPSGHETAAAAFCGAAIYLAGALPPRARRAARGAAVIALVLVGLARVLLRAHWPSDVLGGAALGLALASAAAFADAHLARRRRG